MLHPAAARIARRRSGCGWRREEAAARSVRTFAAPELSVGRGLSFAERNRFVLLRPDAGERPLDDHIAFAGHHDAFFRDHETVAIAEAPFTGGVAMSAAGNPAAMCYRIGN